MQAIQEVTLLEEFGSIGIRNMDFLVQGGDLMIHLHLLMS